MKGIVVPPAVWPGERRERIADRSGGVLVIRAGDTPVLPGRTRVPAGEGWSRGQALVPGN